MRHFRRGAVRIPRRAGYKDPRDKLLGQQALELHQQQQQQQQHLLSSPQQKVPEMFAFASLVALASAALPNVLAHGGVLSYEIEGQIFQGWKVGTSPSLPHNSDLPYLYPGGSRSWNFDWRLTRLFLL